MDFIDLMSSVCPMLCVVGQCFSSNAGKFFLMEILVSKMKLFIVRAKVTAFKYLTSDFGLCQYLKQLISLLL